MMKIRATPRGLFVALALCLSLCLPFASLAALQDLKKPYTHSSQGEPLAELLSSFAVSQGYSASFTRGVDGVVNGEFANVSPLKFLASIRAGYGVEAYTLGSTLYFFNQNERRREVLRISSMPPHEMRDTLLRMGALSADLPSDASKKERLLFIEGPENYVVNLVASIRALEESQQNDQVIRVFPLRHAWADDTTIENAANSVLLPGVATVLRTIVTGQPGPAAARTLHRNDSGSPLLGSGLAGKKSGADSAQTAAPPAAAPGPSIIAEPRSNAVIIADTQQRMAYYEAVIAELDKPVDLVEIHAAIVDINANYAYDLGVNWGGQRNSGRYAGSEISMGSPTAGNGSSSSFAMTTLYTSGINSLFANIRALEERGEGAVLSRPSVLTMDNVQASLEYTTTFYIKLEGNEAVDLVPVTSGTSLKVTPRIQRMPDGKPSRLAMTIAITDGSDPVQTDKATWVGDVPSVKKVTINTQAVVSEGQSLLLGGFYYEQRTGANAGVPGLMDARPFFGNEDRRVQRMERIILISPRVISYSSLGTPTPVPERVNEQGFALNPSQPGYTLQENFHAVQPRRSSGCSGGEIRPEPVPVPRVVSVPQPPAAARPVAVPQPPAPES
jgi:type III secretion protein C